MIFLLFTIGTVVGVGVAGALMLGAMIGLRQLGIDLASAGEVMGFDRYGIEMHGGGVPLFGISLGAACMIVGYLVGNAVMNLDWREIFTADWGCYVTLLGLVLLTIILIVLHAAFQGAPSPLAPYVELLLGVGCAIFICRAGLKYAR